MGPLSPSAANVRRWAIAGLIFAVCQSSTMAAQYSKSQGSPTVLACLIVSLLFLAMYCVYVRALHVRNDIAAMSKAKWLLVSHLLAATWYFWAALVVFLARSAGIPSIISRIFDEDDTNDLKPSARRILASLLAFTLASVVNDLVMLRAHGQRAAALGSGAAAAEGVARGRLPLIALFAAVVDVVLVLLCGLSLGQTGDYGTVVLILLALLSLLAMARHWLAVRRWDPAVAGHDVSFHTQGQFLALQHTLLGSTVLLVNLLLLLLWSVGLSVPSIVKGDSTGQGVQVILSILFYVGILLTSCVLVGMHVNLEGGDAAAAFHTPLPMAPPPGGAAAAMAGGPGAAAVPLPYHYDSLGGSASAGAVAVAVPVPLGNAVGAVPVPLGAVPGSHRDAI